MDSKLLEKFFSGACSPEEVAAVLAWFEKEELEPGQEQELYQLWQEAEPQQPEFASDTARILAGLRQAIDSPEAAPARDEAASAEERDDIHPNRQWTGVLKVAAAVLLPLGLVGLLLYYFAAAESAGPRLVQQEAPRGTRKTIRLADESTITLHPGSQITYPEPFAADKREITLRGEAFFEVAQHRRRPFRVRTGPLTTQALGTSFNIRYRLTEQSLAVALATGSVQVIAAAPGGASPVARLQPGQQLVYDRVDRGYAVRPYDSREVLGWRQGVLYFKKANLRQVVAQLENWYGVEIQIESQGNSPEKEWLYTGAYDNQRLEDVLTGISFVKDFTYEKKGNKILLMFN